MSRNATFAAYLAAYRPIAWNIAGVYIQQSFFSSMPAMVEVPSDFQAAFGATA
ncbi:hypothetical protein KIH07_12015 [Hydrogenophaga taeniospiralis]|uniref:hypothetical protein n=1 Tax=Hydrogenophaga taeniospiralis TaxID=65656 RepID=UPI001CF972AD|nr:hypothetical protein [Hydrogenophaga taeniospiralis]MCB4364462.1 hypothetical protein [Hydrogenophaga taeniospiralis]